MKNIPIYGIDAFSGAELTHSFYANDLQNHLISHRFINAPHKHSTYITIFFTQGTGTHDIDFNTYEVRPGSIFLLTPGQVHCWELSEEVNGYVFFHTEAFYNDTYLARKISDFPFFYLQTNYPVVYLPEEQWTEAERLFRYIYEAYQTKLPYYNEKLTSLIDLVYILLAGNYHAHGTHADQSHSRYARIKKLEKLIDEHFNTKKYPKQYADLMHMTPRHLNRLCRETLGQSTGSLILKRIMVEAQRMLIHTDISIGAVAEALGYEDYSYFIRLFKKQTGESPKKFQQRMATAKARLTG